MKTFFSIIALIAAVSAQAPAQPPQGQGQGEPCPPQFSLQCCEHVVGANDASALGIQVNPAQFPGLAAKGCKALNPQGGQCAQTSFPICCKQVSAQSALGCIPA